MQIGSAGPMVESTMNRRGRFDEGTNPSHYRPGGHMRNANSIPNLNVGRGRSILQRVRNTASGGLLQAGSRQNHSAEQRRVFQDARGAAGMIKRPMWFKIEINNCRISDRMKLFRDLVDYVDIELRSEFIPVMYRFMPSVGRGLVQFWLASKQAADCIVAASNRVQDENRKPMRIIARPEIAPIVPLKPHLEALVKTELDTRYNPSTGHLDLSSFGASASADNVVLSRPAVSISVAFLVAKFCGGALRSVDLSKNRLKHVDAFSAFVLATSNVTALNLSDNMIVDKREIRKLRGWRLTELNLDNNPMCNEFHDVEVYTRDVHAVFPDVTKLDNVDVQPRTESVGQFGLDQASISNRSVPAFKPGFYVSNDIKAILEQFVMEYVKVYDSPSPKAGRQALMNAYHATDSQFTMVVERINTKDWDCKFSAHEEFSSYRRESHNISAMQHWHRYRSKLCCNGNLAVVAKLCKLPATEHLLDSLMVDVSLCTDAIICCTLTGLLREGVRARTASDEIRFFSRSFLLLRTSVSTVAVLNEMLFLSPFAPNSVAKQKALIQAASAQASANLVDATFGVNKVEPGVGGGVQQPTASPDQLILQLSNLTRMKVEWAKKCLEDNSWDLQAARNAFESIRANVPAEAFIQ